MLSVEQFMFMAESTGEFIGDEQLFPYPPNPQPLDFAITLFGPSNATIETPLSAIHLVEPNTLFLPPLLLPGIAWDIQLFTIGPTNVVIDPTHHSTDRAIVPVAINADLFGNTNGTYGVPQALGPEDPPFTSVIRSNGPTPLNGYDYSDASALTSSCTTRLFALPVDTTQPSTVTLWPTANVDTGVIVGYPHYSAILLEDSSFNWRLYVGLAIAPQTQ